MTIELTREDNSRFIIGDKTGVSLMPSLTCAQGESSKFIMADQVIEEIEVEDWASRPDNEDIGGTIRLVMNPPRMDVLNGDVSHKETWYGEGKVTTMFDIKKNGSAEYEAGFNGFSEKIIITHSQ